MNVGFRCNNRCVHCHVQGSPDRMEMMDWRIFRQVLDAARRVNPKLIDITGGAPELNPHLREFVSAIRREDCVVQIRTNLTVLLEPGMEEFTEFYRDCEVKLLASMIDRSLYRRSR